MNELIRYIRNAAKMSQEQFASELGTTALSINRWENSKTEPNLMAQKQIYLFCQKYKIDIGAWIVDARQYTNDDDRLILYHGSKSGIVGDIRPESRAECDFGKGFYMGTNVLQPMTLVCGESKPKLYTIEMDLTGLNVLNIDIDMDWAMYIAYNRKEMEIAKGSEIYEKYSHFAEGYDVIVGYIADDRMYTELAGFFNLTLTDAALINCLSALDLGKQYVAVTEKACRQINVLKEETLSHLELSALKELSTERRNKGTAIAKEVEVKYRREGRYFDEILRGE